MSNTHGIDNDDPQLFHFDSDDESDLLNMPLLIPVPAQTSFKAHDSTPQMPSHDGSPTSEEASTMGDAEIVGKGKGVTRTLPIPVPVAAAYDSYENSASTSRGSRQSSSLILTPLTSPQYNHYSFYHDTQQQFDFLSIHDNEGDMNREIWSESKGKQTDFPPVLPPLSFSPTELSSPSLSPPHPVSSVGSSSYGSSLLSLSRIASDPSSQVHASSSPSTHEVSPLAQSSHRPRSLSSISVKSNRFLASRSMSQLRSRLSSSRTSNTLARKLLPRKPIDVDTSVPGLITAQTIQGETCTNLDSFADIWRTGRKLDELCPTASQLSDLQSKDNISSATTLKHKGRSQSFPLSALDIVPLSTPDAFVPIPLVVKNYFDEALPRELRLHVLRSLVDLHEADHLRTVRQGRWNVSKASSSRNRWVGRDKGVREIVKFSRVGRHVVVYDEEVYKMNLQVSKSWGALAFDGQLWVSLDLQSFPNMSEYSILRFTSISGQCIRSIDVSGNSRLTTITLQDMTDQFCVKSRTCYTQLTDINLQGCSALTTSSLDYLLRRSPSLQKLCLKGLKAVTNSTCTAISASNPQLVSLNVSRCINMDAEGIKIMAKAALLREDHLQLRELRMSGLKNITDNMMTTLGKATPCLEVLDLSYARQLHNSAVDAFVACKMENVVNETTLVSPRDLGRTDSNEYRIRRRVTRLRHLSLSYCILLTDDACSNLTFSVPNLEFLELGGIGPDMRDDGLIRLLGTTPYIRRLDLEDAANITDSVIFALTPDPDIPEAPLTDSSPAPEPGHALEQLNISFATNVSNEAIIGLIRACTRLKHLEVDNTHVNSAVVKEFVRTCYWRRMVNARVNVVDCRWVTENTVKDLSGLTRPRMGWRAYEARKLGFLDARDGNADELKLGQDECDETRVVLKSFSSWQTVDNVRSAREKKRKSRRGAAGVEGGDSEGDEGGGRSLRWWSPGGRRSPPRSSGRNSPLNIADINSDGCIVM